MTAKQAWLSSTSRITRDVLRNGRMSCGRTPAAFHTYKQIEQATGVLFYFATPYHSWERGTNENTNGLIRQYLPKRTTMKALTQSRCNQIACILNNRPRKRHAFLTPIELLSRHVGVAVQT